MQRMKMVQTPINSRLERPKMNPNLWGVTHFLGQFEFRKILQGAMEGGGIQTKLGRFLCKIRWRECLVKVIGRWPWTVIIRIGGLIWFPFWLLMTCLMGIIVFDIGVFAGGLEFALGLCRRLKFFLNVRQ